MKRAIKIIGVVVVLLLAVVVALPFLINANQFRPLLETKLTAALGREVTLGGLKLCLLSGSVGASDVSIADDPAFSKSPFVRASSLQAGVELTPLILSHELHVTRIAIDQPQIDLVQNEAGVWNFSSIGAKSPAPAAPPAHTSAATAPDLSFQMITITNGRVVLAKAASKAPPLVLDKLNIQVKDFSADAPFSFSLAAAFTGGGAIKLDGKTGPINAGNAIVTPLNAKIQITHLDLGLSGAVDPALGVAGLASVDGSVASNGTTAQVIGKFRAERIKLVKTGIPAARPLEVDFTLEHDLTKQSGNLKRGDIHLGKAVAALTGSYNVSGPVPVLNLNLAGSKLDVTELSAFLPSLDVLLPSGATIQKGAAEVNLKAEGPADRLVAAGTVGLDSVVLADFDLVSKLTVLDEMAGIKSAPHTEIQTFHATLKTEPDGTTVQDLELVVPSIGTLTGAGTVSPAHELAFKMRAALHSAAGAIASLGSKSGIPFTVSGTSNSPSFKADVKDFVEDKFKDLKGDLFGKKKKDPAPPSK